MDNFEAFLKKTSSFKGVYSRKDYFCNFLFLIGLVIVSVILPGIIKQDFMALLPIVVSLYVLWAGVAAMVKRLRDLDKSPWYILVSLVPLFGLILTLYLFFAKGKS